MPGVEPTGAHEGHMLTDQRRVHRDGATGQPAQPVAVRGLGAAERERHSVRYHRKTAITEYPQGLGQALEGDALGDDLDEVHSLKAFHRQVDLRAPADTYAEPR